MIQVARLPESSVTRVFVSGKIAHEHDAGVAGVAGCLATLAQSPATANGPTRCFRWYRALTFWQLDGNLMTAW